MTKKTSHQIDFAKRHIATEVSTFDAFSAIYRLELLIEDAKHLIPILQPKLDERLWPSFHEFASYYKVGFVTCLEWHAKSRLYDLFCFDPRTIDANDLKQTLSSEKLREMIIERLSVSQILANINNITTSESYINSVARVFKRFDCESKLSEILSKKAFGELTFGNVLSQLMIDRNNLVHEIGIADIGHPNVRDFSTLEEIVELGENVIRLIKLIERQISEVAPSHFPNILEVDGTPSDPELILQDRIKAILAKFDAEIKKDEDQEVLFPAVGWFALTDIRQKAVNAELAFLDTLDLPGRRYYDVRPYLRQKLLLSQLSYLEELSQQLLADDDPELQ